MPSVQFTGLASGLDTDSIVEAMLQGQQSKIDSAKQAKTKLQWKQDIWKDVNKSINDFYSKYVDKMKSSSTFQKYAITNSNVYAVTLENKGSIPTGKHTIEVTQLATEINKNAVIDAKLSSKSKSFKELGVMGENQSTTMTVNNVEIEITADDTLSTLEKKIKAADKTLNVNFDVANQRLFLSSKKSGTEAKVDISLGEDTSGIFDKLGLNSLCSPKSVTATGVMDSSVTSKTETLETLGWLTDASEAKIKVNGTEVIVTKDNTLEDIENKFKAADSNLDVNINLSDKTFNITTHSTGLDAKIELEVEDNPNNVWNKLGITGNTGMCNVQGKLNIKGEVSLEEIGVGAKYKYNGALLESATNNVKVNGLELTLMEQTTEPVHITVESDPEETIAFIKEFIEGYNTLIDDLNKKYNATKNSLQPLTDAQKESMTDKQIEEHEKMIKDSLLRRDSSLYNVINNLRSAMQSMVKGNEYGSLSALGITTGDYSENGKLYLKDDTKLREALKENPDAVIELFTSSGETYKTHEGGKEVTKTKKNTTGVGYNLYQSFLDMKKRIDNVKSYESYYNDKTVTNNIKDYTDNIKTLQTKYDTLKKMYQKKFAAMEASLSKLNSQGASLTNMLGQ